MTGEEKVTGTIEEIRFFNDENGFVIAVLDVGSRGDEYIYIKGYIPFISEGQKCEITGKWKNHPVYGDQMEVTSCHVIKPTTVDEIEKYLASGIIKGIGPKLAAQIVARFGEDTFDIIRYKPENLKAIHGIGTKKLEEITESFREEMDVRNIIIFLQGFGLSMAMATKIYKKLGSATVELVSRNPYMLVEEIERIGFKTADAVASKLGIEAHSPYRINSALKHVMARSAGSGDTYIPLDELVGTTAELITVDSEEVDREIREMIIRGEVVADFGDEMDGRDGQGEATKDNPNIYSSFFHYAEWKSAKKLAELKLMAGDDMTFSDTLFDELQENLSITLHENQKRAVRNAVTEGVSVITGGPGTGKTTIIKSLIAYFNGHSKKVLLAAPTGRAAKRMTEATLHEARTIHRLLEYQYSEMDRVLTFQRNEDNPLQCDVVIIDEFSMVDIGLFYYLLEAIKPGTRLILVGDSNQLPSVGPGTVLFDIIKSGIIDVTPLTEIFRQSQESMIVVNAHRVNGGEMPILNSKDRDFFFMSAKSNREAMNKVVELCQTRLPSYYHVDSLRDIHVLSVTKAGDLGVNNLNTVLQSVLNAESDDKIQKAFGDRIYRVGDKVMQIKNNYNKVGRTRSGEEATGIFNGDVGFITAIDDRAKTITVDFDDEKTVSYDYAEIDEITLSYAMTVHKSQGSEYPIVVMPLSPSAPMLMNRNILYTAITRAKRLVVLVGSEAVLRRMVDGTGENNRRSGLYRRLLSMKAILDE